ncbi:class I SAM-dependent methyltransferase [Kribbella sandramycini]|uniref:Class I SAM-dependent methyltransferase n=1 Tax=Kribbella sandramycini TaxID=60450 RepID=A0A7Y4KW18_9ACTN|nr:class I SAM-dependent methyltransferase [Kribbella sandramycini]MBB6567714.1 O-methyltransferase [Kribbella sandramycini]NOL39688.1 class I SAM-dependent methyltransferase [Kribbella sandramycini]
MRRSEGVRGSADELGAVGQTLLTPLYARANASEATGFTDPLAALLLSRVDYDEAQIPTDPTTVAGTIYRAMAIDELATAWAANHPDGRIISAGIGLCTRHARIATPAGFEWYGVDTADVIAFRRKVLPDDPVRLIESSITEPGWTDNLGVRPTLVIAEGLLMYLDAVGVRTLLRTARETLGAEVVADYLHPLLAKNTKHPITTATGARFGFGVRNGRELARLTPGYRLAEERSTVEPFGGITRLIVTIFRIVTLGQRTAAVARLEPV